MMAEPQIILVTGAARSGKSEWAETLAKRTEKPVFYLATSSVDDPDQEWRDRVQQHQQRRPNHWQTLEVAIELPSAIETLPASSCVLIDSLGTWVANGLAMDTEQWQVTTIKLLDALKSSLVEVILVAEETGWGVVPAYQSGRLFRDRLGSLTRRVGMMADIVYLVTGGHVLNLTQLGQRLNEREGR
jgi:adenosylcobinamide kinase/adenosylcobinamide-phosphate guanylyltransferase